MSLSDFSTQAFRIHAELDGVTITRGAQTVTVLVELTATTERPYDGAPGPAHSTRIHLHADDLNPRPKVGETLVSQQKRYRIAAVHHTEGDPILILDCNDTPL